MEKFEQGSRLDFDKLLLSKLPEILSVEQKKSKIKNILQKMKLSGLINVNENRHWILTSNLDGI